MSPAKRPRRAERLQRARATEPTAGTTQQTPAGAGEATGQGRELEQPEIYTEAAAVPAMPPIQAEGDPPDQRRYVIQHRTSAWYIAALPSLGVHLEVESPLEAIVFRSKRTATAERNGIPHFADAYEVVTVGPHTRAAWEALRG